MMTDKEKIESFADMVNATEKLSAPWRDMAFKLIKALILTNLFWAVVLAAFVWFAYMAPDTTYQEQDFRDQAQMQSSGTEVVTRGD